MFHSSPHPPTLAASTAPSGEGRFSPIITTQRAGGGIRLPPGSSTGPMWLASWLASHSLALWGHRRRLLLQDGLSSSCCVFVSLLCHLSAVMSTVSPWQPRPVRSSSHHMVSSSIYTLAVTVFTVTSTCEEHGVEERRRPRWHRGERGQVPGGSGGLGAWGTPVCQEVLSSGLGRTSSPQRRRMTCRVRLARAVVWKEKQLSVCWPG